MSGEINVVHRTQHIIVDPASSSIAIINEGPQGPGGPTGEVSTAAMNQAIDAALATKGIPPGGLTGQVLVKLSDADYDVGWVTLP
jgi:hypothetical protein